MNEEKPVRNKRSLSSILILLGLVAIMLPAIQAILNDRMIYTHDGMLHFTRLIGLDHAVSLGEFWPRYLPGLAYGYGFMVFNYYSPVSLYFAEIIHLLGATLLQGFIANGLAALIMAGLGAFLLGREWGDDLAGILTAASYVYAPYLLSNWFWRGAIGEFWALAILPWVFWAFKRLIRLQSKSSFTLAASSLAILVITHNITAMIAAGLLGIYCVALIIMADNWKRALVFLLGAGVSGLLLSAFFWLPALGEKDLVQIGLTVNPEYLKLSNNFLNLRSIFLPAQPTDASQLLLSRPAPTSLSPLAVLFSGFAAIMFFARFKRTGLKNRIMPIMLSLVFFALLLMMLPVTTNVWQSIGLLRFVQFPWRLIGFSGLIIAAVGGVTASSLIGKLRKKWQKGFTVCVAILLIVITGLPWTYGQYLPDPPGETISDAQRYEIDEDRIGGTAEGEYLPVEVKELPDPERLLPLFRENPAIPRLQENSAVVVVEEHWSGTRAELDLMLSSDTTLIFNWFTFPGWVAEVDGMRRETGFTDPEGLITLTVPEGEHHVVLAFRNTPLRQTANGVSIVGLITLIGMFWVPIKQQPRIDLDKEGTNGNLGWMFAAVVLTTASVMLLKTLWIDRTDNFLKPNRFAEGYESIDYPLFATVNDQITLLGCDLNRTSFPADSSTQLTVYWQPKAGRISEDYSSLVQIKDSAGQIMTETLSYYPQGVPTSVWLPGYYVAEEVEIVLPTGTAPGVYTIEVGLYDPVHTRQLPVLNAGGMPVGVMIEAASFEVLRPLHAFVKADLGLTHSIVDAELGPFTLISASAPPSIAMAGDPYKMTWFWRAEETPAGDYQARLVWLDLDGQVRGESAALDLITGFTDWQKDDVFKGIHAAFIPGSLTAGDYQVAVELIERNGGQLVGRIVIGEMTATEPERSFALPALDVDISGQWENGVVLSGLIIPDHTLQGGLPLDLSLVWQTESPIQQNLKIFIHLVDTNGVIVAQADSIPVGTSRPFTGWMVGEIITDSYSITLPASLASGDYSLRIGIYDPISGLRTLIDGAEYLTLERLFNAP